MGLCSCLDSFFASIQKENNFLHWFYLMPCKVCFTLLARKCQSGRHHYYDMCLLFQDCANFSNIPSFQHLGGIQYSHSLPFGPLTLCKPATSSSRSFSLWFLVAGWIVLHTFVQLSSIVCVCCSYNDLPFFIGESTMAYVGFPYAFSSCHWPDLVLLNFSMLAAS